jgi:hypothetical protein
VDEQDSEKGSEKSKKGGGPPALIVEGQHEMMIGLLGAKEQRRLERKIKKNLKTSRRKEVLTEEGSRGSRGKEVLTEEKVSKKGKEEGKEEGKDAATSRKEKKRRLKLKGEPQRRKGRNSVTGEDLGNSEGGTAELQEKEETEIPPIRYPSRHRWKRGIAGPKVAVAEGKVVLPESKISSKHQHLTRAQRLRRKERELRKEQLLMGVVEGRSEGKSGASGSSSGARDMKNYYVSDTTHTSDTATPDNNSLWDNVSAITSVTQVDKISEFPEDGGEDQNNFNLQSKKSKEGGHKADQPSAQRTKARVLQEERILEAKRRMKVEHADKLRKSALEEKEKVFQNR